MRWYTGRVAEPILDDEQRASWHDDGWCVLEHFLPAGDVAAAQAELPAIFPSAEAFTAGRAEPAHKAHDRDPATPGRPTFPLEGDGAQPPHPATKRLIALAEDLLGTELLRLYQGHATAKYSDGDDPEYEQLLHVDYGNHTLVVPRGRCRLPAPRALRLPQ